MNTVVDEAVELIKSYESLAERLPNGMIGSYLCPSKVWTIGYGSTSLKGKPVTSITTCTQAEAELQFQKDVQSAASYVSKLIDVPLDDWQFSALTSLVQNIGPSAFADSTIRRRINAGEDILTASKAEFPRWIRGEDRQTLPGLVRRRQAELALMAKGNSRPTQLMDFRLADAAKHDRGLSWQKDAWQWLRSHAPQESWDAMQSALPAEVIEGFAVRFRNGLDMPSVVPAPKPPVPATPNPLTDIPRFTQRDSKWIAQRDRKCYSSTNAMLVEYLKPGTLPGPNGDDAYLARLQSLGGDTTEWPAQQRTLASFGIKARLVQTADWRLVEEQIKAGRPVPVGYLHRGPLWGPRGSGHWCLCYGTDAAHIWISDPWGEPDLVSGATLTQGNWQGRVTKLNFSKRWMVEPVGGGVYRFAPGKGWAVVVDSIEK